MTGYSGKMEDWQYEVIKTKKDKLISLTRCNQLLLAILEANGILSSEEKHEIDSQSVQMHKAAKLYDIIQGRRGAYDILVNASKETNQSGLTEILADAERANNFSIASRECWKIECIYNVTNPFFFIPKLNFECLRQAIAHYVEFKIFKVVFGVREAMKPWLLRGPINETLLHISVAYGYRRLIKHLISLGVDPNSRDIHGRTPLHYVGKFSTNILETTEIFNSNRLTIRQVDSNGLTIASTVVRYGNINQYHYHHWVDYIVKTGYGDIFAQKSKDGSTSLHHALEMLDLDNGTIESILKSSNLSINQPCDQGHTALHFALISGRSLQVIKNLIKLEGDYEIKDEQKEGALHLSARGSNKEVMSFLISLKFDVNEVDEIGETPLHKLRFTKTRDYLGMITFLLNFKADLLAKNMDGNNLAHLFAKTERISADEFQVWVKGMTDSGYGHLFAVRGRQGRTPLQSAMLRLDLDFNTIKLILESSKVDIDQPDEDGDTALYLALNYGRSIQTIKNLIQLGANIKFKNNNGSGALHLAVIGGNKEVIQYLVSLELDVNEEDKYGCTPLHNVPRTGVKNYFEMTKLLLDNGADLCAKDTDGYNIAHLFAINDSISLDDFQVWVKGIIDNGHGHIFAARGHLGRTPLQVAIQRLDLDFNTIKLIFESSEVSIDQPDDEGFTVLLLALDFGRTIQFLKNLIQLGANIKLKDKQGTGALHRAVRGGDIENIQYLVSLDLDVNDKDEYGITPLHCIPQTTRKNYFEMTKLLLDNGADLCATDKFGDNIAHLFAINDSISLDDFQVWVKGMIDNGHGHIFAVRGQVGRTPLQMAMERFDLDFNTIKLILESSKVNIDQPDDDGCTLLHLALGFGRSIQTIKDLILLGANIKLKNNDESGALHSAVIGGNKEVIQYLVSIDLDVNEKNANGRTPLHCVPKTRLKNYFEITKLLLDNGADLCAKDKDGMNSAHLCALIGDISSEDFQFWVKSMTDNGCGHIFAARSFNGRTPLQLAVQRLDLDLNTIKLILESSKVNINQPHDDGCTLLHLALKFGRSTQTIKNLIQLGASIKLKNKNGSGALHLAVIGGNKETIQYLVSLDLDVNDKDEDGITPLHHVPQTRLKNYFEMTKLLLDNGADLCAKDKFGDNVAHLFAISKKVSQDDFEHWVKGMTEDGHGHIFATRSRFGSIPLPYAMQRFDLDFNTIKLILESSKVNVDQPDDHGDTFMHLALNFGRSIQTIKNLIQLGANFKLKNNSGTGALHFAVVGGNKEAIQYLISLGLDINEKDKYGQTPLHDVRSTRSKDYLGMTKLLLENGANLSATDINGKTLEGLMSTHVSTEEYCLWKEGMIQLGYTNIFQWYSRNQEKSLIERLFGKSK